MFMQPQTKTNRSLGNSQSRLSAMPSSPAYGNTTNVNGAQTAVGGQPVMQMTGPADPVPMLMGLDYDYRKDLQGRFGTPGPELSGYSQSSAPIYPGGDAPGIATYYRNSAIQGYQGGQQQQQSAMAGDVREATRNAQYMAAEPQATSSTGANQMMARQPADLQNAVTARAANSSNGMVGAMSDPNRLTPNQKAGFARESALRTVGGGAAADPTGLGARFGGALGQQATSDAEAIQGGRAVRLADGTVSRFTGTPESARTAQLNGKVERESLRDRSNMNVPQEELDRRDAADTAKRGRSARAMAFEDQNGMNYKQADRLARMQERVERQVAKGQITRREADIKLDNQQKRVQSRFQERNSALDAPVDRVRLPNGQLPEPTRQKAAETAKNMTNPEFTGGSPQFKQEAEIIRSVGLTNDMSAGEAMNVIKSSPFPLEDREAAKRTAMAYKRYWGSKRDADKDWSNVTATNLYGNDQQFISMMNELAETPDENVEVWVNKYSGHLAAKGQPTARQENPGYGLGSF